MAELTLTGEELDALTALETDATPASWAGSGFGMQILTGDSWNTICEFFGKKGRFKGEWEDGRGPKHSGSNSAFIAALRNAAPALLAMARRTAALEAENFVLAADQCHAGYGDERGNHRCKELDAAQARIADLERELYDLQVAFDPPVCRLQFPDGTVPGNAAEGAEGWKRWYDRAFENVGKMRETAERIAAAKSARIADLENGLKWITPLNRAIEGLSNEGLPLQDFYELARVPETDASPSFRLQVGHIRRAARLLAKESAE